ncbi:MAG: efflux RND transporter periplasmic adaptor subunit, partial [Chloroflexota bacterium]
ETWTRTVANAQANMAAYEAKLKAQLVGYDTEEVIIKDMQVAAAEMALTQAQDNLKKINEKINDEIAIKELQLKFAGESVALAQKSASEAQRQLNETIILAPFDGVVAKVSAEEGDTISPVNTIIHILDPVNMKLSLELDEIDVPQVKPGQEAVITLDALPGKKFTGKVSNIFPLPRVVGGVVLYDVKINFDVPKDTGIKVGMSASADVITDKRTGVLLVPNRAVTQDKQGKTIVKIKSGEQVTERPVITGVTDDVSTEIISGLSEGDTVVIQSRPKAKTPSIM